MTVGPQRRPSVDVQRTAEGYDIEAGVHGTAMRESGTPPPFIDPANILGRKPNYGLSDPNRAYYVARSRSYPEGSEHKGWKWATNASRTMEFTGAVAGRPVVHEVKPVGTIDVDRNLNYSGGSSEMTAERLKVVDTHWIRPPSVGVGIGEAHVQGTLPHVNWNQFPGTDATIGRDWNNLGQPYRSTAELQESSAFEARLASQHEALGKRIVPSTSQRSLFDEPVSTGPPPPPPKKR